MTQNGLSMQNVVKKAALGLGLVAGGLAVGCTTEEVNAVLTGVQVVTDQLTDNGDISFGDWLSNELDD